MREPEDELVDEAELFVFRCLIHFFHVDEAAAAGAAPAAAAAAPVASGLDEDDAVVNSFYAQRGEKSRRLVLGGKSKHLT